MAIDDLVFFDTSVLVAGLVELGDTSLAADRILDGIKSGTVSRPLTSWHCCLECYSVATRLPAPVRVEPGMMRELLEEEVLGRFEVADLPASARAGGDRADSVPHRAWAGR